MRRRLFTFRRLFMIAASGSLVLFACLLILLTIPPWKSFGWNRGGYGFGIRMAPGIGTLQGGITFKLSHPFTERGAGVDPEPNAEPHISVGDRNYPWHEVFGCWIGRHDFVTTTWISPREYQIEGQRLNSFGFRYLTALVPTAILPIAYLALRVSRHRKRKMRGFDVEWSRRRPTRQIAVNGVTENER